VSSHGIATSIWKLLSRANRKRGCAPLELSYAVDKLHDAHIAATPAAPGLSTRVGGCPPFSQFSVASLLATGENVVAGGDT